MLTLPDLVVDNEAFELEEQILDIPHILVTIWGHNRLFYWKYIGQLTRLWLGHEK